MDAITMLGNQGRPTPAPVNLMGLSPEEIRGVSSSRTSREQMMFKMIDLLAGQRGREATIAAQEAATSLSETKQRGLERGAEIVTIKDAEGNDYKVPRSDLTESIKLMDTLKRNKELNLLTVAQTKAIEDIVPITIGDETFQVSPAHYTAIAEAGRKRKEAETKTEALESLEGLTVDQMTSPEHMNAFMIAAPNAFTAWLNRRIPDGAVGLSDTLFRHYSKLYADYSTHLLKIDNPDDALIETVNSIGQKLRQRHMILKIPHPGLWGAMKLAGVTKAVTVNLPSGITAADVSVIAAAEDVSVSDILQGYYDKVQGVSK